MCDSLFRGWVNSDSMTNKGRRDQQALLVQCKWNHSRKQPAWPLKHLGFTFKRSTYLFGGSVKASPTVWNKDSEICFTPLSETKLLAQRGPHFTEVPLRAWALFSWAETQAAAENWKLCGHSDQGADLKAVLVALAVAMAHLFGNKAFLGT